jgi:arsenate reductase (thioredoxin)
MGKPVVLFLCTGNSARSQMAEAFLRKYAGDRFEVVSAGTEPKGINPLTARVMDEIGISLAGHRSKSLDEYLGRVRITYAITVCGQADQSCPSVGPFFQERLFWPFDDPAVCNGPEEARLQKFREVRDQIAAKIQEWLASQEMHNH